MVIPQGDRKRKKGCAKRHFRDTALAQGVGPDEDDLRDVVTDLGRDGRVGKKGAEN
jgi:hypothetical protein